MAIFGERLYTSITVKINQLCDPLRNEEIDDALELYLKDLLELIKLQPQAGPTEAARAIRKKLKYGDLIEEQLRALQVLELLVLNSGPHIGPKLARDDKLLDVLKGIINGQGKTGISTSYPAEVQKRTQQLSIGWKNEFQDMDGYQYMAVLYKNIPHSRSSRSRLQLQLQGYQNSRSSRHQGNDNVFNDEDDRSLDRSLADSSYRSPPTTPKVPPPRPDTASPYSAIYDSRKSKYDAKKDRKDQKEKLKKDKKDKKKKRKYGSSSRYADQEYRIPQINYKVEAPKIRGVIADCHTHTTALNNLLTALPTTVSPLDDDLCQKVFEKCVKIRRKVLRYLQFVGAGDISEKSSENAAMDEEFLGSLIMANDQLVSTFKRYDSAAGYTEANPAPSYDDEESSGESYYTDETTEEEEEEEEEEEQENEVASRRYEDQLADELANTKLSEKRKPPPIPKKPLSLTKFATNGTTESDPFGDSQMVTKSVYE